MIHRLGMLFMPWAALSPSMAGPAGGFMDRLVDHMSRALRISFAGMMSLDDVPPDAVYAHRIEFPGIVDTNGDRLIFIHWQIDPAKLPESVRALLT